MGERGVNMRENTAKAKLKRGEAIIGTLLGFTSPQLVEIAGRAGFDFLFIDCEHGAIGLDECENLVRAADNVELSTIVRVPTKSVLMRTVSPRSRPATSDDISSTAD